MPPDVQPPVLPLPPGVAEQVPVVPLLEDGPELLGQSAKDQRRGGGVTPVGQLQRAAVGHQECFRSREQRHPSTLLSPNDKVLGRLTGGTPSRAKPSVAWPVTCH